MLIVLIYPHPCFVPSSDGYVERRNREGRRTDAARTSQSYGRAMTSTSRIRHHVVIAGGGVAALETLLALRALAGHRARITVLSHEPEFLYRPVTVAEPFERGEARAYQLAEIADEQGADFVWDALAQVDADQQVAITRGGKQ